MVKIALKMLTGDRAKYWGLVMGITFATFLMSQQISIFFGIIGRTASQINDVTEADIWVMDNQVKYFDEVHSMPQKNLARVRSVAGVEWAVPLYKGLAMLSARSDLTQQIILIGVDDSTLIGRPPKMIFGNWEDLKKPDAIIVDKAGYELMWPGEEFKFNKVVEIGDRRAVIVGLCEASPPFQSFPVIFTRYSNATDFTAGERYHLTFVLAKAKAGIDQKTVIENIRNQTGLEVLSREEFSDRTIDYYVQHTGIPINFGITVALGFIIGTAIAGQTFYIFVIENLRQFGALKAIGVTNKQILQMVFAQAATVGFIGFSIGIGMCALFFALTASNPALRELYLLWQVIFGTALAVMIIITFASMASIRKVLVLDPATVFKS